MRLPARGVDDVPGLRRQLRRIDAELRRRRGDQHLPRGGTGFAQRLVEAAHRTRAARDLRTEDSGLP